MASMSFASASQATSCPSQPPYASGSTRFSPMWSDRPLAIFSLLGMRSPPHAQGSLIGRPMSMTPIGDSDLVRVAVGERGGGRVDVADADVVAEDLGRGGQR